MWNLREGKDMRQGRGIAPGVGRASVAIVLVALLAGCGALRMTLNRGVKPPAITVTSARVEGMSFTGAELMFDVQVDNPNPVGLDILGYDYHVEISGHRIASGTSEDRRPVDGEDSVTWSVPVSVGFASLLSSVASLATEDETTFSFECAVRLDLPFVGEVSVPVSRIGALPLPKAPSVSFAGVSLGSLSTSAAELVVKLRVANPNNFLLRLESLTYELGLGGDALVSAAHDAGVEVFAGSSTVAELPVRVDLRRVGLAAAALLRNPANVPLSLAGTMRLAAPLPQMPTVDVPFAVRANQE
jgi:LEA14-like dessication related protein